MWRACLIFVGVEKGFVVDLYEGKKRHGGLKVIYRREKKAL